jgi:hypothetical protein
MSEIYAIPVEKAKYFLIASSHMFQAGKKYCYTEVLRGYTEFHRVIAGLYWDYISVYLRVFPACRQAGLSNSV